MFYPSHFCPYKSGLGGPYNNYYVVIDGPLDNICSHHLCGDRLLTVATIVNYIPSCMIS